MDEMYWVLVDVDDRRAGGPFTAYEAARSAAVLRNSDPQALSVAVVEVGPEGEALVWTPEGREHAVMLTWPPS